MELIINLVDYKVYLLNKIFKTRQPHASYQISELHSTGPFILTTWETVLEHTVGGFFPLIPCSTLQLQFTVKQTNDTWHLGRTHNTLLLSKDFHNILLFKTQNSRSLKRCCPSVILGLQVNRPHLLNHCFWTLKGTVLTSVYYTTTDIQKAATARPL